MGLDIWVKTYESEKFVWVSEIQSAHQLFCRIQVSGFSQYQPSSTDLLTSVLISSIIFSPAYPTLKTFLSWGAVNSSQWCSPCFWAKAVGSESTSSAYRCVCASMITTFDNDNFHQLGKAQTKDKI